MDMIAGRFSPGWRDTPPTPQAVHLRGKNSRLVTLCTPFWRLTLRVGVLLTVTLFGTAALENTNGDSCTQATSDDWIFSNTYRSIQSGTFYIRLGGHEY
jgi:hypothetical protein